MRYGYAVLDEQENDIESEKLFFDHILFVDRIFFDRGEDRSNMHELLEIAACGDEVVLQSKFDCGLSASEIASFRYELNDLGAYLFFFEQPVLEEVGVIKEEIPQVEDVPVCDHVILEENGSKHEKGKRGRKKKQLISDEFLFLLEELNKGLITKKEMAEKLGVCYATLQKNLSQYKASNE